MKMKVLEEKTGVGRETIRYYIREGLLPAPEKPHKNVAIYTKTHVDRMRMIKKLQDERFLPLHVIKSLLADMTDERDDRQGLAGLEFLLAARLGAGGLESVSLNTLTAETGLSGQEIETLADDGLIDLKNDKGTATLSGQDAKVVRLWARIRQAGYDDTLEYDAHTLKRYDEAAQFLAKQEVSDFFDRVSGRRSTDAAAALAETGITLVEEIFSILHIKAIIREIAQRNAEAILRDTEKNRKIADSDPLKSAS